MSHGNAPSTTRGAARLEQLLSPHSILPGRGEERRDMTLEKSQVSPIGRGIPLPSALNQNKIHGIAFKAMSLL